ncbi:lamin tail domain-containing protein [Gaetbulibacter sp. PBL-D1]|uniref:lamin tail domain-containing protein n=1 Tax=Gaetbulibacter sp. PBL-D1 TaxID=3422594 RepID=UPI003D2F1840
MKKKYSLVLIAFLCLTATGFGQVTDLIISEYGEGTPGSAKYVEIYNGTGGTVNLSNYQLWKITNGGSWNEGTYNFTTSTLADGATIVIANNSTNTPGADEYNSGFCSWNGDDAVGLAKSGTLIDVVGTDGADPGTGWAVAGTNNATVDHTLTRKSTVCGPNTNWSISAGTNTTNSEWILTTYGNGAANSGHTSSCASTSDLAISGAATDHGSSCLNTSASTLQYTITNNGAVPAVDVNVVSDDPQFVVSNLSSTTIAPSGTATYDVTFTPTAVGAQTATLTISSTTITDDATSILTGTGITAPNITTQPTNQNEIIPNTATFSVASSNATTYQWEVNSGSGWNNVTGGTGATTNTYTTGTTNATMDGNLYRCVLSNTCGSTTSNSATLNLSNPNPNNVTGISGCFEDNSVILNWTLPTGITPTGYVVFAIDGGTDPAGTKTDANTYTANSDFSLATPVTPASLGRVVYKGNATSATITGLTENNNYSFTVYSYVGESLTGWASGDTGGSTVTNGIAQGDISNLTATPLTNQVNLSWNNPTPTSCWDQLIIVANQGSVTFTPTGDGSAYSGADNDVYTTPNQLVYETTANVTNKSVTGLVNGLNYCFKVFIRRGTTWSEGVEVCSVPTLTYCSSDGGTNASGILNVNLNTIDNSTVSTNSYSDYTAITTNLTLGDSYNLSVNVNTSGNHTSYVKVWIDWNQDGTFNNSGNEAFELGTTTNSANAQPSLSPLSITVPTNAALGNIRMRVSAKSDDGESYATPCEYFSFGEVEDYTINVIQPTNAEINVKGNNITIPNGFNAPYGLNNTLFGSTNVGSTSAEKSYFVENIGATALNLTGAPIVEITGANASDFTVTLQPNTSIASSSDSEFRIEFSPTADGTRTATVNIVNSDSDENPYTFDIEGTGVCTATLVSSIWPIEGPENTEVTITSAEDLTGAYAELNGLLMTTVSSTSTELVVLVPAGAASGNLVVQFPTGCSSTNSFTFIDNAISGCETALSSTIPNDLFISEVTDATSGSSSYVEIFNGTSGTINLSDYSINVYNNGNASPSSSNALSGNLASGSVYVVALGTTSCSPLNNLSVSPNQTFSTSSGINFDNNSSDMIALYKISTTSIIDAFGVYGSGTWANGLGIGGDGVNFRRQNNATPLPSSTFDINDWDMIDWTGCSDSDYVDIGLFDFSLGIPPTVSVLNTPTFDCNNSIQLTVNGSEGVAGGLPLSYQWYYLAPNATTFVVVPNNVDFNNDSTSATLDIINPITYIDYQFYCQVRENSSTCYTASNAVKISAETAIWDGTNWSSAPASNKTAILNADYNTSVNVNGETSFEACNLIINDAELIIADVNNGGINTYVEVGNDLILNGTASILVHPQGAFVQINDDGLVTADNPDNIQVNKRTAMMDNWYEYTYWSSPVFEETIGDALVDASSNRRFKFSAQDYRDSNQEINNTNTFIIGQDNIDDPSSFADGTGYDWQQTNNSDFMTPGVGYASTHDSGLFSALPCNNGPNCQFTYSFRGLFNNGVIEVWMYRNDEETNDNNWNLLGNPYPSAISADAFLNYNADIGTATNRVVDGAIYLWSQNTPPDGNTSGNEQLNFSQSDYAIINGVGETATSAGGDGSDPTNRMIPSGQAFFIAMSDTAPTTEYVSNPTAQAGDIQRKRVVFNNSMRVRGTNDNSQFFRQNTTNTLNKLWLDLTTDNGVFNQILVGYVDNATNSLDKMYFDAPMASPNVNAVMYSIIEGSDKKYTIQGRAPESLTLNEVIPLGFSTLINTPTIYTLTISKLEGEFLTTNTIYVKDKLLNITHNLSETDYTFTSEAGEFNERFEIVFMPEALSIDDKDISPKDLTIIELNDNDVKFTIGANITIEHVEIIDLLGRTLYNFNGNSNSEIYNLSALSQATYLAKVTLSNGQVITKKAVKRK